MLLTTVTLIAAAWSADVPSVLADDSYDLLLAVALVGYSAVGTLVATRRVDNRVGWILLATGLFLQLWLLSLRVVAYGLTSGHVTNVPSGLAAWLGSWTLIPGIGLAFAVLPLLFPDGRLASRRHRPLAVLTWFAVGFTSVTWALEPTVVLGGVTNPLGVELVGDLDLAGVGWALLILSVLMGFVGLSARYRRSGPATRRQIRWLVGAVASMASALVLVTVGSEADLAAARVLAAVVFPIAVVSVPIAASVAILKEDLYDFDPMVAKSIGFGLLVTAITALYLGLVVGIGALASTAANANVAVSVLAAAVVALAAQPARARLQRLADRVVYGPRAVPYEVLAEFSERMGATLDASEVLPEMARALAEGTGARRAEVWLVVAGKLDRVSSSIPDHIDRRSVTLDDDRLPTVLPDASQVVPVRNRGELVGALSLELPTERRLSGNERRLVSDLATQAGLVLSNVRLVEELKASRQRLLSAHDDERRRLERDIHDGVQQHLVTLALELRMLAGQVGHEPDAVMASCLENAATGARETLSELRRLSRGIHPAAITESGLAGALASLAERTPLPVHMRATQPCPLPVTVEVTVYYLVAEALTNAAKHADASAVTVDLVVDHAGRQSGARARRPASESPGPEHRCRRPGIPRRTGGGPPGR
jgi:signal transduction histidine kinase